MLSKTGQGSAGVARRVVEIATEFGDYGREDRRLRASPRSSRAITLSFERTGRPSPAQTVGLSSIERNRKAGAEWNPGE